MTRHTYRNVTTLVVGLILAIGGLAVTITRADSASVPPPPRTAWMSRPCVEEDSHNCTWNAQLLGDGRGHSFYVVKRTLQTPDGPAGHVVCYFYVKRADAKRWDDCATNRNLTR